MTAIPENLVDFAALQRTLSELTDENFDSTYNDVINSPLNAQKDFQEIVSRELFIIIPLRHKRWDVYVKFVQKLLKNSLFNKFKSMIMQFIFGVDEEWEIHIKASKLKFGRLCMLSGMFTPNEAINYLTKIPVSAQGQYFLTFCYFAPEVYKANKGIFENFRFQIEKMSTKDEKKVKTVDGQKFKATQSVVQEYINIFDVLIENNFEKLYPLITTGCNLNTVELDIYNDDVESMKLKLAQTFNTNKKIDETPFHPAMFLQWRASLLEMCAFYGSIKCFNYLLTRNARTSFIGMFATAGAFPDILKRVEELKEPFESCLRIAGAFRDLNTMEWLMNNHMEELKFDKEINYVLARGAYTNYLPMLDFCVSNNVDINFSDENGETALHLAVKMNNKEALQFLISRPHLQYRKKNVYGLNPHAMTKNAEILNILNTAERKRADEKARQKARAGRP